MSKFDIQYSSLTVNDRNKLKGYLQRKRLQHSLRGIAGLRVGSSTRFLDVGAGDAELARILRDNFSEAEVLCYEPAAELREQALANVGTLPKVSIVSSMHDIADRSTDVIFGLEAAGQ